MNILKKYRDSSGFSQRQLADKSEVNIRMIQYYEQECGVWRALIPCSHYRS